MYGSPLQLLVGIAQHSVLGTRWVYDGCGDPVWASALALAVLAGGTQAEELIELDGEWRSREATVTVLGSGTPGTAVGDIDAVSCRDAGPTTVVDGGGLEIVVARVVGAELPTGQTLTGWWAGGGQTLLASVRPISPT